MIGYYFEWESFHVSYKVLKFFYAGQTFLFRDYEIALSFVKFF